MLVVKQQVEKYIPQKSPFVMVDMLIDSNPSESISQFLITNDNLFCKEGKFQETGLIENIAQTAALASGYAACKNKEAVKKGFIGAVKRMKVYQLPEINDNLTTRITTLNNVMFASIIKGEIKVDDVLIAECEMSIFTGA